MNERGETIRLRAEGHSYRKIAAEIGRNYSTVYRWCNPAYEAKARRFARDWKRRNKARMAAYDHAYHQDRLIACQVCGRPTDPRNEGCRECRFDEADRKARLVVELWRQGRTYPEIKAEMGWSSGTLSQRMFRYRSQGYDLPYRYRLDADGVRVPR